MDLKKNLQPLVPHLLVLLGFLLASIIYNYPMLEGKKLYQNDQIQAVTAAEEARAFYEKTGELTLWTNSMFGGMPTFMIYMDYPNSWTTQVGRLVVNLMPAPASYLFLYLVGFYLMMIMLGYDLRLAILGAIGFAFASYSIINIEAGHISKVWAMAVGGPLIAAVVMTYRGKYLLGAALTGLFAGIELYANHIQITYYLTLTLVLYVIYRLILIFLDKDNLAKGFKTFGLASAALLVAGLLSLGSHASRFMTNYYYSQETIRGQSELSSNTESKGGVDRDYAFQWSYGKMETFTLLIPNFYGGGSGSGTLLDENSKSYQTLENYRLNPELINSLPYYWGGLPFTSGPAYAGAIICFLFLFGLIISRDPIKWWLLAATIFLILLAWGKNLSSINYLIFDYLPLYDKFRAVSQIMAVVPIFMVWMAVLGLQELLNPELNKEKTLNYLKYSAGTVGGLALVFALLGNGLMDFRSNAKQTLVDQEGKEITRSTDEGFQERLKASFTNNPQIPEEIMRAIREDRASLQSSDAWRSFIFIALATALLWVFLIDKLALNYVFMGLIALNLIDLWAINRRYLNEENFLKKSRYEDVFDKTQADRTILADEALHFRVLNTTKSTFQDATTSYYHHSVGGYHGAKLRRYNDLINAHLSQNNLETYHMLNTKYFILGGQNGEIAARQNPDAMGNAWFVQDFEIVKNADEEIEALQEFDPAQTAFIDQRFQEQVKDLKIKPDPKASIQLTDYQPNALTYESETKSPQLAVFSEIYYKDAGGTEWKAFVDGKEVPHFRANYVLRAMVVPAGKHKIEFRFVSPPYVQGETIALICSILLTIGLGVAIYFHFRQEAKA